MNIIVHYPKNPQDITKLRKAVAAVHAEAVIQHINKLPCPQGQKLDLHSKIKKAYRDKR